MISTYKKLGPYIRRVDERNANGSEDNLLGVSTQKVFIKSIANTVGTNFKKYKVVRREQFVYIPDTSRRGDKIGLAMLDHLDQGLVSQAYTVFEVIDHEELDPEYLMMWFRRPEFDRYARFKSHGSVREIFGWDEMCDVDLPVPDIIEQRRIVSEYKAVTNRIKLNKRLIKKLEDTAQAIYKQWFIDFDFPMPQQYAESIGRPERVGQPYKSSGGEMKLKSDLKIEVPVNWTTDELVNLADIKGGKRLPKGSSLTSKPTEHPYIKVADMGSYKFVTLNKNFEFLTDSTHELIKRYTVKAKDLIISIVGTIGLVRLIDSSLDGANLTENCVKVTNFRYVGSDYIYHYLNSSIGQRELEMRTVGGVQGKLPIYNIGAINILIPDEDTLRLFHSRVEAVNSSITAIVNEISRLEILTELLLSRTSKVGQ